MTVNTVNRAHADVISEAKVTSKFIDPKDKHQVFFSKVIDDFSSASLWGSFHKMSFKTSILAAVSFTILSGTASALAPAFGILTIALLIASVVTRIIQSSGQSDAAKEFVASLNRAKLDEWLTPQIRQKLETKTRTVVERSDVAAEEGAEGTPKAAETKTAVATA